MTTPELPETSPSRPPPAVPASLEYAMIRPVKPRVLWAYLMFPFMVAQMQVVSVLIGVVAWLVWMDRPLDPTDLEMRLRSFLLSPRVLFGMVLAAFILQPVMPLLMAWKSPMGFRRRLMFMKPRAGVWTIALIVLGTFSAGVLVSALMGWLGWNASDVVELGKAFGRGDVFDFVIAILGIGIVGPIAEEIIFRGFIQPALVARHGAFVGILVTTLFFGVWHLHPVHALEVLPMGAMMGIAAWRTGSLWTSIVAHCFNNTMAVILGFYVDEDRVAIYLLMGSAVFFVAGVLVLVLMKPRAERLAA